MYSNIQLRLQTGGLELQCVFETVTLRKVGASLQFKYLE